MIQAFTDEAMTSYPLMAVSDLTYPCVSSAGPPPQFCDVGKRNRKGGRDEGEADIRAATEKDRSIPSPDAAAGGGSLAEAGKAYRIEESASIGTKNEQPKTA